MVAEHTSKDYITTKLKKKKEKKSGNYVLFNVITLLLISLLHIDTANSLYWTYIVHFNTFNVKDSSIISISLR